MDYQKHKMDQRILIQVQDNVGTWRTYHTTFNDSQLILMRMKEQKNIFPDKRVRAVDEIGRRLDMM